MKIRLEADVPDTWEPGDCENCPFAYTEYFPAEWVAHCVFDGMDMDCPASVVADDDEPSEQILINRPRNNANKEEHDES